MSKKTVLEINNKLIFEDENKYVEYLSNLQKNAPQMYERVLRAESRKDKKDVEKSELTLSKVNSTVRVYEIGLV